MLTLVQNLGDGKTSVIESPLPLLPKNGVLVQNTCSLISIGTERSLLEFGKGNMLSKARQQPEKVKMVLEKVSTDGALATLDSVKSKLNQPIQMGYCAVGSVIESNTGDFAVGDRVVTNGSHAEVVSISRNLAAKIPDGVSNEWATFVPVASIGLQGVRLVAPSLGETVVVMGLGLIGLLTVQLLVAHGCNVIGVDFSADKVELAEQYGARGVVIREGVDTVNAILSRTKLAGVDAVLITASTKSSDPVTQAARCCRKRGRIVLVGVTGLQLNRSDFYEKELSFQVSCSYGAGRYDPFHEEQGHDYPIGFVRWTERRNFEAILQLMENGRLDVSALITSRHTIDNATAAYKEVGENRDAMGILLDYPERAASVVQSRSVTLVKSDSEARVSPSARKAVSFFGSGNYASRILMPAFKAAGVSFDTIVNRGGVGGTHHGAQKGFARVSTDEDSVFLSDAADIVVIATRHDSHAQLTCKALQAGKHVFVEKPLALTLDELSSVTLALENSSADGASLMVGFNRRFAPLVVEMKHRLDAVTQPKCFNFMMNAGAIPADSWVQSTAEGGGRIVGEACHLIDLMRFLAGSQITDVHAMSMGLNPHFDVVEDKAVISLKFADGSIGSIQYFANGGKAFPKERLEVFAGDAVLQLDNYRALTGFGWNGFKRKRALRQDKGQNACVEDS